MADIYINVGNILNLADISIKLASILNLLYYIILGGLAQADAGGEGGAALGLIAIPRLLCAPLPPRIGLCQAPYILYLYFTPIFYTYILYLYFIPIFYTYILYIYFIPIFPGPEDRFPRPEDLVPRGGLIATWHIGPHPRDTKYKMDNTTPHAW